MATHDIDFSALYSRHLDFVWRNLRALGVPAADLEDATQDTFIVAYRRREDFRPGASMRAWLYGIARRVAYRQRRGGGRRARLADAVAAEPHEHESLEAMAQEHQAWQMALAFLDELPAAQREAYWLTEIEGLTAAAAGAALGVSGNTVSSRLRAARESLARHGEVLQAREAGELRRALRRHAGPTSRQRRSAAAALAVRLGALTKAAAAPLGGLGAWAGAAAALGVAIVGVSSLGGDPEVPAETAKPAAVVVEAPKPSPDPASTPSSAPSQVPAAAPARLEPPPASDSPRAPITAPATPPKNLLTEEAKLLRSIKGSVRLDPKRALSLLEEHRRRFPRGVLGLEATALRVQAACALGREAEAEGAAQALPAGHAWADGCPDGDAEGAKERPTRTRPPGEGEGI